MTIYGQSEELVSRCVECDLAEPESLPSLGGSAPGLGDGILSLPHVSLEVGIEDTKHEGLFSLKKLFLFRFTTWSIVGIQDLTAFMGLGNYE